MGDVLSRTLDGAGPIRTVSPSVVLRRWRGRADRASAEELGRRTGAGLVVYGAVVPRGRDSVTLRAALLDRAGGTGKTDIEVSGEAARIGELADSLGIGALRVLSSGRAIGSARGTSIGSKSLPGAEGVPPGRTVLPAGAVGLGAHLVRPGDRGRQHVRAGADPDGLGARLEPADGRRVPAGRGVRATCDPSQPRASPAGQSPHRRRLLQPCGGGDDRAGGVCPHEVPRADDGGGGGPTLPRRPHGLVCARRMAHARAVAHRGAAGRVARGLRPRDRAGSGVRPSLRALAGTAPGSGTSGGGPAFRGYLPGPRLDLARTDPKFAWRRCCWTRVPPAEPRRSGCSTRHRSSPSGARRSTRSSHPGPTRPRPRSGCCGASASRAETPVEALPGSATRSCGRSTWLTRSRSAATCARPSRWMSACCAIPPPRPGATSSDPLVDLSLLGIVPDSLARATFGRSLEAAAAWGPSITPRHLRGLPWWLSRGDTAALARFGAQAARTARAPGTPFVALRARLLGETSAAFLDLARGDTGAAIRKLSAIPDTLCLADEYTANCFHLNLTLARLLAARGDDRRAGALLERWRWSGGYTPSFVLATLELGRIAERLGDTAEGGRVLWLRDGGLAPARSGAAALCGGSEGRAGAAPCGVRPRKQFTYRAPVETGELSNGRRSRNGSRHASSRRRNEKARPTEVGSDLRVAPPLGSSRRPSPKQNAHGCSPWALLLLGSSRRRPEANQDSPDPESVPPGQRFRSSCPETVTYRASVPASLPKMPAFARRNCSRNGSNRLALARGRLWL